MVCGRQINEGCRAICSLVGGSISTHTSYKLAHSYAKLCSNSAVEIPVAGRMGNGRPVQFSITPKSPKFSITPSFPNMSLNYLQLALFETSFQCDNNYINSTSIR